jgi:RimJ/RimL family protein N-acetyltransferase
MTVINLKLREIADSDFTFLYKLLKDRDPITNISHKIMPTYKQHIKFINSKPYQKWYIIEKNRKKLGSIYFSKQNEIGIHFIADTKNELLGQIAIQELMKKNPNKKYFTNINPKNYELMKFFEKNAFSLVQYTLEYDLVKIATNFIKNNKKCKFLDPNFAFEIIDDRHTNYIIKWRNEPSNFQFFANQEKLNKRKQHIFLKNYMSLNRIDFVLVDKKTRKPYGTFSLTNIFSNRPEIGKLLGNMEIRGKGVAYRATKALLNFAFEDLKLKKVYSITRFDNISNKHVNKKLGFKIIGNEKIKSRKFIIMSLENNLK